MRVVGILFAVVGLVAACGGGGGAPALRAEEFASGVVPPLGLDKLRIGMSLDDVKRTLPGLKLDYGSSWKAAAGRKGVRYLAVVTDGKLSSYGLQADQEIDLAAMLAEAWGEPARPYEHELHFDDLHQIWRNPEQGWRADLSCGEGCILSFREIQVLTASFLGKRPAPPAELAALRLGMPRAELQTLFDTTHLPEGCSATALVETLGGFSALLLTVPASSLALFKEAWGDGEFDRSSGAVVWLDRTTRWHASWLERSHTAERELEPTATVSFSALWSATDIVGGGPEDLALFARAGLGATEAELRIAYGEAYETDRTIQRIAFGSFDPKAYVFFAGTHVSGLMASFALDKDPLLRQEVRDALEARFGKPTTQGSRLVYRSTPPRIEMEDSRGRIEFVIRYGELPPGW